MTIPVHKKVIEILSMRGGKFPPAIIDQTYNDYLKIICKKAGLTQTVRGSKKIKRADTGAYRKDTGNYQKWELVTSHIGRRSFASNFYGEIPTSYLIYMTGHSSEEQFLAYIGKSNKDLALEMNKYF